MEPQREGSKLRLKRRKPLGENAEETPLRPAGAERANGSSLAWFQKQDLSNAESTWMRLLTTVDPTLSYSSLVNVARLPPFHPKSIRITDSQPKPKTFSVGMKEFQWVPFPIYCRESPDLRNRQMRDWRSHGHETVSVTAREENEEGENPKVGSWVLDQKTFEQAVDGPRMQQDVKLSSALDGGERTGTCGPLRPQNPAGPSSSTPPYHEEKSFDGFATLGKTRSGKEPLQKDTGSAPPGLPPSVNVQNKEVNHSKEPPGFEQCPMCQMHFSGTWTKMELDSHLAQCLSESADDEGW